MRLREIIIENDVEEGAEGGSEEEAVQELQEAQVRV